MVTMKQLTFLELSKKVLEEEKRPLSAEEIWEIAQTKGYDREVGTRGKTPPATIGARIYIDIRDSKDSPFIKVDSRPRRFFLRSLLKNDDSIKLVEKETTKLPPAKKFSYLERDLHLF